MAYIEVRQRGKLLFEYDPDTGKIRLIRGRDMYIIDLEAVVETKKSPTEDKMVRARELISNKK